MRKKDENKKKFDPRDRLCRLKFFCKLKILTQLTKNYGLCGLTITPVYSKANDTTLHRKF